MRKTPDIQQFISPQIAKTGKPEQHEGNLYVYPKYNGLHRENTKQTKTLNYSLNSTMQTIVDTKEPRKLESFAMHGGPTMQPSSLEDRLHPPKCFSCPIVSHRLPKKDGDHHPSHGELFDKQGNTAKLTLATQPCARKPLRRGHPPDRHAWPLVGYLGRMW